MVICASLIVIAGGNVLAQQMTGETWLQSTDSASFLPRYSHSSVVFNGGSGDAMWVVGGNSVSSGLFNDVWYSRDGITWTMAINSAQFPARADHTSVAFQKKMWVIGGYGGARTFNDVWQSSDGITWNEVTASAAFPVRYGHTSVVFDDKIWVIGGSGDSGNYYNDVWYSSDGATWHLATNSAQFPPRYSHTSVVFDNKIWVIGGYNAQSGNLNDVWYSSDGITWEEANSSVSWPARGDHTSLVFDHRMWVMGGSGDSGNFQDVWYSADGEVWTPAGGTSFFPARTCHSSVIFEKKAWVLGGWGDTGNLNDVWFTTIPVLPEVTAVSPVSALNITTTSVLNLDGSNFMTGASVFLNRSGGPDIPGTDVTILSPTRISCQFDLTGTQPGKYTVVVTNPDGQQGILSGGFTIISADADRFANTTINGLTLSTCTSPQKVTIDTGVLSSMLQADGTMLELQPPSASGLNKIVLYALNGTRFSRTGNTTITGTADGTYMETGEIASTNFSHGMGSFSYSMALPSYPCNGQLRTTLWEGALPDDEKAFIRIAEGNNARYDRTAYSVRITRTHFPLGGNMTLHMGLNSSWVSSAGEDAMSMAIEGIADDKLSGSVLPTSLVRHDPLTNLDHFQAVSPGNFLTFGLSAISDTDTRYQSVLPGKTGGDDTTGIGQGNPVILLSPAPAPGATQDSGQTASLSTDKTGVLTEPVTLQSTDLLARMNIGKGTLVKRENGTLLTSVTIQGIVKENLPPLPPESQATFAGRAYALLPNDAVLSPEILVSFIAPRIQTGHQFQVKTFDMTARTWVDIPTRYDTETATVTAQVSNFSVIALFSQVSGTSTANTDSGNPDPQSGTAGAPSGIPVSSAASFPWIASRILDNIFIIIGVSVITLAIFLRTRKPRRYRVLYEK